jgi:hypothetical protein
MDTNTKSKIAFIIDYLKDDLAHAKSELSRLDYVDEATAAPGETHADHGNQNPPQATNSRFGVANLPIHFTLGRGVADALGDEVQQAVFTAFRRVARGGDEWSINHREVNWRSVGMSIDLYWDKENRCACLHLELVHTDERISMDEFGEEIVMPQGRSLN